MSTIHSLNVVEVAERLDIKTDTVYRCIAKHGLSRHRLGCNWRFEPEGIDVGNMTGQLVSDVPSAETEIVYD